MIIPKMFILGGQRKAYSIVLYAGHWLQEVKCHLPCSALSAISYFKLKLELVQYCDPIIVYGIIAYKNYLWRLKGVGVDTLFLSSPAQAKNFETGVFRWCNSEF